jgi:hypothetical protein
LHLANGFLDGAPIGNGLLEPVILVFYSAKDIVVDYQ